MPALLAVSASEGIQILTHNPTKLTTLHENTRIFRSILDKVEGIHIPSHPASPLIHIQLASVETKVSVPPLSPIGLRRKVNLTLGQLSKVSNPQSVLPSNPVQFDIETEERILQEIVDEALGQGVLLTRAKRLRGQEVVEPRPGIKIAITNALTRKEVEKSATVIKNAVVKILNKKRK